MNEDLVEQLRRAAPAALGGTPVLFAYLFGSMAVGRQHAESDVDVAVYLDPSDFADRDPDVELDLAGRLADESGEGRIEVLVLNEAPLPLRGRVVRDRRVLYSRDEPARVQYETRTLNEFFDFEIHARELDRELLKGIAEGRR